MTPLTIVTAADAGFFTSLQNLLWTVLQAEPASKLVVWDLRMTTVQLATIKETYPAADVRTFDFSKYPSYFNLAQNDGRIAFRPAILSLAAAEFGGQILWLDSTCIVMSSLLKLRAILKKNGFYAKSQNEPCGKYLFPAAAKAMSAIDAVLAQPLCNPGISGFDCGHPAGRDMISRWYDAALNPAITNPPGFKRTAGNHAHESAVFTVLIHHAATPIVLDNSNVGILPHAMLSLKEVQFRRGFKDVAAYRKWRDAK